MESAPAFSPPCERVSITVAGAPTAKGRPRVFIQGGRAIATTPPKTRRYEDLLRLEAGRVMEGRSQLDGALAVRIRVYVQTPQAIAKHKIKGPSAEAGVIRPLTRPDIDNYAKGPLDALNGIVWRDDSLVVQLTVEKFYSSRPRLELEASEL